MPVIRINNRDQLIDLAHELGIDFDWHEPDNRDVTAVVLGHHFDNAGFWGEPCIGPEYRNPLGEVVNALLPRGAELYVQLFYDGKVVAEVNLATLFSFACGHDGRS